MVQYLEFSLLDEKGVERNVKMNANDPNEVYVWKECKTIPCYWKRCAISDYGNGYSRINITKKPYALHRVCYFAHNPEWDIYNSSPDNSIDHIDRDKGNNHITNLRQATHSQNNENRGDVKGYSYCNTNKRWVARVMKDGKTYRKHCRTEEEAIAAREKLKAEHHTFSI